MRNCCFKNIIIDHAARVSQFGNRCTNRQYFRLAFAQTLTVPMIDANWRWYGFVGVAIGTLVVAAVHLLVDVGRRTRRYRTTHGLRLAIAVARDVLLLLLVAALIEALFARIKVDAWTTVAAANGTYADPWPACHAQVACASRATTLAVVATLGLFWPRIIDGLTDRWTTKGRNELKR